MHHILPMASYRRKLNHIVSNHRLAVVRAENKHVAERISKVIYKQASK